MWTTCMLPFSVPTYSHLLPTGKCMQVTLKDSDRNIYIYIDTLWICIYCIYRSRWNLRLCTMRGVFWRMFHKCIVSSAVTVTKAPSFTRNWAKRTAHSDSPSCLACASTQGRPKLRRKITQKLVNQVDFNWIFIVHRSCNKVKYATGS